MKRRLYQLDVFTSKPFAGNPLAVVTDGDGLSTRRMQAIAKEMNLSETVFIQKPTSDRALARLRIFTTEAELPLAGHPVIGTWFLLAELGVVPARDGAVHVWQQTGAGVLPVEIEFDEGRPLCVTMTQRAARFKRPRISRPALAAALGLKPADFDPSLPIESVSTGVFNLMVPLRRREALKRIRVNQHALLKAMGGEGTVAYCFALAGHGKVFARGMLPWAIQEDPATGSAAARSPRTWYTTAVTKRASPSKLCKASRWAAPARSTPSCSRSSRPNWCRSSAAPLCASSKATSRRDWPQRH